MNRAKKIVPVLLAGLLAGGAFAQTATSDVPVKPGEASTMTQGKPNMATTNNPAVENAGTVYVAPAAPVVVTPAPVVVSPAPVTSATGVHVQSAGQVATHVMGAPSRVDVVVPNHGAATMNVPNRAGEVSTMTNGVPNVSTHNPVVNDYQVVAVPTQPVEMVPQRAGEASTMVRGRPNVDPNPVVIQR